MKRLLLFMCLSVGIAHAEPAPVLPPSPTLPDTTPTRIGIVGNDVIRPTSSANAQTYKKVPLDTNKMGQYFKKLPKRGLLDVAIIVGLYAVDYLLNPENNEVRFNIPDNNCWSFDYPGYYHDRSIQTISTYICERKDLGDVLKTIRYSENSFSLYCTGGWGESQSAATIVCPMTNQDVPLDELADKLIDSAKKGNPNAVRVINDWADDEIRRNPDAYPDIVPQPQPQPQPDPVPNPDPNPKPNPVPVPSPVPQPTPSPNPNPIGDPNPNAPPSGNPATNPNPADNPSGTPNAQPDPATNPSDGTKPNEQPFKFELPAFCSWAGVVCDFIDWVKKDDTDKEDTEFELEQDLTPDIDTDIKFNGQCPADVVISGTIFGQVISFTFFEWSKFCGFLAMLKPIIIALASYQAVRIVGGVNVAD